MSVIIFKNNKYTEYEYKREDEFEDLVKENGRTFFGESTIYIDLKSRINASALGQSIPDGFLFDLGNINDPVFYLVEIELAKHDFYRHIFPQITKFIAFFRDAQARDQLMQKVFDSIKSDKELEQRFKSFIKEGEIFKFIKDAADDSQNILLIIDELKPEIDEVLRTYTEWNKMVRLLVLKEFRNGNERIHILEPEFEAVETGETLESNDGKSGSIEVPHTEEYHLDGKEPAVKEIYSAVKAEMIRLKPSIIFNSRKYYISIVDKRSIAYIQVRKKKLVIVVMLPETTLRSNLKHLNVGALSEMTQKFWGGSCANVTVENTSHLDELFNVLKLAIEYQK